MSAITRAAAVRLTRHAIMKRRAAIAELADDVRLAGTRSVVLQINDAILRARKCDQTRLVATLVVVGSKKIAFARLAAFGAILSQIPKAIFTAIATKTTNNSGKCRE